MQSVQCLRSARNPERADGCEVEESYRRKRKREEGLLYSGCVTKWLQSEWILRSETKRETDGMKANAAEAVDRWTQNRSLKTNLNKEIHGNCSFSYERKFSMYEIANVFCLSTGLQFSEFWYQRHSTRNRPLDGQPKSALVALAVDRGGIQ